jgi:hypothetical protein
MAAQTQLIVGNLLNWSRLTHAEEILDNLINRFVPAPPRSGTAAFAADHDVSSQVHRGPADARLLLGSWRRNPSAPPTVRCPAKLRSVTRCCAPSIFLSSMVTTCGHRL